jgi:hypothetical protein
MTFIKPIIKKIIEYIASKDNKLHEDEVNEWIKEAGFELQIEFNNNQLIIKRSK